MGHMQAQWYETDFWRVETSIGTEIVPMEVESDPARLAPYVEGTIESVEDDVHSEHSWLGRLSAPGYLDCTDWVTGETEKDVKEALADLYDLCPEHMCELDENYECPECAAERDES